MSAWPASITGPSCVHEAGLAPSAPSQESQTSAGAARQNRRRSSQSEAKTGVFSTVKLATQQRPGSLPGRRSQGERAVHTWRVLGQPGLLAVNPSSTKRACARCLSTTAVLQCASHTRTCENTRVALNRTCEARTDASEPFFHCKRHVFTAVNAPHFCIVHSPSPPPEQSRLFTAEQNAPPTRPLAPDNDAVLSVEFLTFAKVCLESRVQAKAVEIPLYRPRSFTLINLT